MWGTHAEAPPPPLLSQPHTRPHTRAVAGGTTAVVFEGVHRATGQHVALKVISLSADAHGGAAALEREARCAAAVRHPHVARLLDAFSEEGRLVLVVRVWR